MSYGFWPKTAIIRLSTWLVMVIMLLIMEFFHTLVNFLFIRPSIC
jgi:hypothetical protein